MYTDHQCTVVFVINTDSMHTSVTKASLKDKPGL